MKTVTLFCLPFAGGNQFSFRELRNQLPEAIKPVPLDYPGRGMRMREPLVNSIEAMSSDIFAQLKGRTDKPYAIYGHSMGAIIGYEVAHKVMKNNLPLPIHLFVSGRNAPSCPRKREPISHMPSAEFRKKIKELGGSPDEVLNNDALMELFEPILRNDFHAHEVYKYLSREKFNFPVTAMYGTGEDLTGEEVMKWGEETQNRFTRIEYTGDHFFIFNHWKAIADYISQNLL